MKVIFLLICLILMIGSVSATPPSAINGTGIFNITESHGATWIQWNWIIPDAYTTTNYTYLRVMVDGEEKYNMSLTDSGDRSQEFTLSDVNANEYHRLELRYISLVDPTLEYVVGSDESVVKTDASIDYYLLLVVTGIGTFLFSLSVRNKVKALVVCSFSTALFLYLSVASMKSNVTLSTASLILASLTLFVILYLLYAIYKKYVLKEVTDV